MDLEIAENTVDTVVVDSRVQAPLELLMRGFELYRQGEYMTALALTVDATKLWKELGDAAPASAVRETQYLMYKAHVMTEKDPSRVLKLPMSFLQLEAIIAHDEDLTRRRAVWLVEKFGKLGLYLQNELDRRSR